MLEAIVQTDRVDLNGLEIRQATSPAELYAALGKPSRIEDPAPPAPLGHRNNQIHVYDDFGIYFHEHHFTRLAMGLTFVFWHDEEGYRFTPQCSFTGTLLIGRFAVPREATERQMEACPVSFENQIGSWIGQLGKVGIIFDVRGARLRSGRRSRQRRVVSLSLSWPHDPWGGVRPPSGRTDISPDL